MASEPPLSSPGDADGLPADVRELYARFNCSPPNPITYNPKVAEQRRFRLNFLYQKGKRAKTRIKAFSVTARTPVPCGTGPS